MLSLATLVTTYIFKLTKLKILRQHKHFLQWEKRKSYRLGMTSQLTGNVLITLDNAVAMFSQIYEW